MRLEYLPTAYRTFPTEQQMKKKLDDVLARCNQYLKKISSNLIMQQNIFNQNIIL
jgi:hypothetical protein